MKIGKEIKQPKEIEAIYNDDSGSCGKFFYDRNRKQWEYNHKFAEMDEEECFEAYKNLKKLNKTTHTKPTRRIVSTNFKKNEK